MHVEEWAVAAPRVLSSDSLSPPTTPRCCCCHAALCPHRQQPAQLLKYPTHPAFTHTPPAPPPSLPPPAAAAASPASLAGSFRSQPPPQPQSQSQQYQPSPALPLPLPQHQHQHQGVLSQVEVPQCLESFPRVHRQYVSCPASPHSSTTGWCAQGLADHCRLSAASKETARCIRCVIGGADRSTSYCSAEVGAAGWCYSSTTGWCVQGSAHLCQLSAASRDVTNARCVIGGVERSTTQQGSAGTSRVVQPQQHNRVVCAGISRPLPAVSGK